ILRRKEGIPSPQTLTLSPLTNLFFFHTSFLAPTFPLLRTLRHTHCLRDTNLKKSNKGKHVHASLQL
ncbi:hypothetical protein COCVIDRAFT_91576, partial [Bipolaris victoriae FI3]